jgi:MoxR-like ATPase
MTDTSTLPTRPTVTADQANVFATIHNAILRNVEQVLRGKTEAIEMALCCLFAGGHLLVEDVPGVGKTSLAKALAGSVSATWHRVQFTPDLLPSDITGVSIWNQDRRGFEYHRGPVFANFVLGDEINRASPKTQAALLEVMEEQQVTVDAVAYAVPQPFMVIATQNPVDLEGTYRLPEAQLDRFLMRVPIGYPDAPAEAEILRRRAVDGAPRQVPPVAAVSDVKAMVELTASVHVGQEVCEYVVAIAAATRAHKDLRLGVSPRGSLATLRAAQARAASAGRGYVVPDDVKRMAPYVIPHRLMLTPEAEVARRDANAVLAEILGSVPVPAASARPRR